MECTSHNAFSRVALDHAQHPRHLGRLRKFNGHARITGPCGDTMEFWLNIQNGNVEAISFLTDGCRPSIASGSMASSLALGNPIENVVCICQKDILDALGGLPEDSEHCALLAANTLKAACDHYMCRQSDCLEEADTLCGADCESCDQTDCPSSRDAEDSNMGDLEDQIRLENRLGRIQHKLIVLSGKGGVGKSTIAVNLATALRMAGKQVGLLDVDIHGPSVPTMLGLNHEVIRGSEEGLHPIEVDGLKVMSLGFLLENQDNAVIWRGPMKMAVIKQFLMDVAWGDLDYLIIDSPPGTGDEPLSICQLINKIDGAIIVTTPQKVAAVDVRKSITFCRQLHVPILGVVENMSGFICPKCGELTPILSKGAGKQIAKDMGIPLLVSIPMDPSITEACDQGTPFVKLDETSSSALIIKNIIDPLLEKMHLSDKEQNDKTIKSKEVIQMKIAIPLADGKLASHFGHCESFALISVDPNNKTIIKQEILNAPPHQPGLLPAWLAERGTTVIIAGGMGQRALQLFEERNIKVVVGAPTETPGQLVTDYLAGTLQVSGNVCDH